MHQTTVRFDSQLWRRIDTESRRIGVSAAQYIRDATLIRLTSEQAPSDVVTERGGASAAAAISAAETIATESQAVWSQARLARQRAQALREASRRLSEIRGRHWAGGSVPEASPSPRQPRSESRP